MQVRNTQVRICNGGKRKYSNLTSILKSLRFSSLAFSVDPLSVGLDQFTCTVPDRCYTQEIGLMLDSGSKIAGATLSSNSFRQTVYTHCTSVHQAAKLVAALLQAWRKVMTAYRQVYDSRHQELGSAPEPYVRQSSIGYLYFFYF